MVLLPKGSFIIRVNLGEVLLELRMRSSILFPLSKRAPFAQLTMNMSVFSIRSRMSSTLEMHPSLRGLGVIIALNSGMITVAELDLMTLILRSSADEMWAVSEIGSWVERDNMSVRL